MIKSPKDTGLGSNPKTQPIPFDSIRSHPIGSQKLGSVSQAPPAAASRETRDRIGNAPQRIASPHIAEILERGAGQAKTC